MNPTSIAEFVRLPVTAHNSKKEGVQRASLAYQCLVAQHPSVAICYKAFFC